MRRLPITLFFLFIGMLFNASVNGAELKHEYQFDSCTETDIVVDTQGNLDGAPFNVFPSSDGVLESALDLSADGTADYVSIPQGAMDGLSNFSLLIWFKTAEDKSQQEILQGLGNGASDDEIEIYLVGDHQVYVKIRGDGATLSSNIDLDDDAWHQLGITRNNDRLCLYIDGALQDCDNGNSTGSLDINSAIIIGQEQDSVGGNFNSGQAFEGSLDELKIYSGTLSWLEILTLYNRESNNLQYDDQPRVPLNCPVNPVSIVADYRFDQCSIDAEILDSSVNQLHGTTTNVSSFEFAQVGRGVDLTDDDDDDWVYLPSNSLNGLSNFTVSLWYQTTVDKDQQQILHAVGRNEDDDELEVSLRTRGGNTNRVKVSLQDIGIEFSSSNDFTTTNWQQLVLTRTRGQVCLYQNGNRVGCQNTGRVGSLSIPFNNAVVVGQEQDSIGGSFDDDQGFEGFIDELRIYQGAMSESQISSNYDLEAAGNSYDGIPRVINCTIPTQTCLANFSDGITTTSSGAINFANNTFLFDNPDTILAAQTINNNSACRVGNSNQTCTVLDPIFGFDGTFISSSSNNSFNVNNRSVTLNSLNGDSYKDINVKKGTLTFNTDSSNHQFFLNKLKVEDSSTVNFSPGDYYISDFEVKGKGNSSNKKSFLNVVGVGDGSGTVRIYTDKKAKFKGYSVINDGSNGDPSKLFIYHIGSDNNPESFKVESSATVAAYIYSARDVELKDNTKVYGSVSSEGEVKLTKSADVHYRNNRLDDLDFGDLCTDIISPVDHYEVIHDGNGLTCESEVITIKACADDANPCTLSSTPTTLDLIANASTNTSYSLNFVGEDVVNINNTIAETVSLSLANQSEVGQNPTQYINTSNGTANQIEFSNAGFKFFTANTNSQIPNQISGNAFTDPVFIQAVKDDNGVCAPFLGGSTAISLAQINENPALNPGLNFTVINNGGATLISKGANTPTTINAVFDNNSIATLNTPTYYDAGQISLYAELNLNGVSIKGSSTPFWVQPASLQVEFISKRNTLSDPVGNSIYVAGDDFKLTISALNSQGDVTQNYHPGDLQFKVQRLLPVGANTDDGWLSYAGNGTAISAISANFNSVNLNPADFPFGQYNYENAQFSEVGQYSLTVQDNQYPCLNSIANCAAITSTNTPLGRFIPDKVELISADIVPACADFTYLGQDFTTTVELQAKNIHGDITKNYQGDVPAFYALNSSLSGDTDLTSRLNINHSQDWLAGNFIIDSPLNNSTINRDSSADGPFMQTDILIGLSDTDGVNFASFFDTNIAKENLNTSVLDFRYGRMRLDNNYGPVGDDLTIPLMVEYWDSANNTFSINTLDSCTFYSPVDVLYSNGNSANSEISGNLGMFENGQYKAAEELQYISPLAPGSVNLKYDAVDYLKFDWFATGDENPSSTLVFGLQNKNRRVISKKEL